MARAKQDVWVVIPTRNEAGNIGSLLRDIDRQLDRDDVRGFTVTVVVVDTNSTDGTQEVVMNYLPGRFTLHYIDESRRGLGLAYKTGFDFAMRRGADVLVEMDADHSHSPADLIRLINHHLTSGADLVLGSRYVKGSVLNAEWPRGRQWLSFMGRRFVGIVGGIESIQDPAAGFRVMSGAAIRSIGLQNIHGIGYAFQIVLTGKFIKGKYLVVEFPITFSDRRKGRSKLRLQDMIEFLRYAVSLRF